MFIHNKREEKGFRGCKNLLHSFYPKHSHHPLLEEHLAVANVYDLLKPLRHIGQAWWEWLIRVVHSSENRPAVVVYWWKGEGNVVLLLVCGVPGLPRSSHLPQLDDFFVFVFKPDWYLPWDDALQNVEEVW